MSASLIRTISQEQPIVGQGVVKQLLHAIAEHSAPLVMHSVQKFLKESLSLQQKDTLAQRFYEILILDYSAKVADFVKVHFVSLPQITASSLEDKELTILKWNPLWDLNVSSAEDCRASYEKFLTNHPYPVTAEFIHNSLCPTYDYLAARDTLPFKLGIIGGRLSPAHEWDSTSTTTDPSPLPSYPGTPPNDPILE